jgi:hypothetical protein
MADLDALADPFPDPALGKPAAGNVKGLQLRGNLPFDAWLLMGRRLSRLTNASPWWLGDWIIYGQHAYGERYKAALEVTPLDYQTLRNYAWVARRFQMSRRRDKLSFQHHAEVASLAEPEQELWLSRAEKLRWSKRELRRRLAAERRLRESGAPAELTSLRLDVSPDREQRWREAAATVDQGLEAWLAAVADVAAEETLASAGALTR